MILGCAVAVGAFSLTFYTDELLGECFGFTVCDIASPGGMARFQVQFDIPKEEYDAYRRSQLTDEDVKHSTRYGDLLDKPKGEVYVGGHYVGIVDNLNYAYNFKPACVKLDRDRKVPKDFDVNWYAARILSSWNGLTVGDMDSRDTLYMSTIPSKIAKKFVPGIIRGKVVFRAGEVQASQNVSDTLMELPLNQQRIAKLKYSLSRKRTPHSVLREFLDAYGRHLPPEGRADAVVLLKKAKVWK